MAEAVTAEKTFEEKVKEELDRVRPFLQRDGGDVEFVALKDGVLQVKLQGACAGCPMSQMTLAFGIQRTLKEKLPELVRVESV
jgi:Fe-S cluster biogenesis protein NfuA